MMGCSWCVGLALLAMGDQPAVALKIESPLGILGSRTIWFKSVDMAVL